MAVLRRALLVASLATAAHATTRLAASSSRHRALDDDSVPQVAVPAIDATAEASAAATVSSERNTATPTPERFAIPFTDTTYDAAVDGVWGEDANGAPVWRLQVSAPGAVHVNFGFSSYRMPAGGLLELWGSTDDATVLTYTADDNKEHGELWTPVVMGSMVDLQVQLPAGVDPSELSLVLGSINSGFSGFGAGGLQKSGSCNVDVVCSQGDDWQTEIKSVAVYSLVGVTFCTGTLLNNASGDRKPYFLTAYHCDVNSDSRARSLVVFWNYETSGCGGARDGQLNQPQTGAEFRAGYRPTDFALLELDAMPNSAYDVHYAGWDRSGQAMDGVVAIHHPNTDEKSISFENDSPRFVSTSASSSPASNGAFIRVADWDLGTTEPGSSGSALFDYNHRVVGQLFGGSAACGNNLPDWYGAIRTSWTGGGSSTSRLSDWLDPDGSGSMFVNPIGPDGNEALSPPATDIVIPPPPSPTVFSSESEDGGGRVFCLSGDTMVEVQGEGMVPMRHVQVGDAVRTCSGDFSPVYSFFHKHDTLATQYLRIHTTNSDVPLEISSHHMLYSSDGQIRTAQEIQVGDRIPGLVTAITPVVRNGLYAPVTRAGHVVVSGACVSNYVALWGTGPSPPLQNWATHAAMSVFRLTHPWLWKNETYNADTGYATQYTALLAFIGWVQATGGAVGTMAVTLIGAPFLALLQLLEQTLSTTGGWILLLLGGLSTVLVSRSTQTSGKLNQRFAFW